MTKIEFSIRQQQYYTKQRKSHLEIWFWQCPEGRKWTSQQHFQKLQQWRAPSCCRKTNHPKGYCLKPSFWVTGWVWQPQFVFVLIVLFSVTNKNDFLQNYCKHIKSTVCKIYWEKVLWKRKWSRKRIFKYYLNLLVMFLNPPLNSSRFFFIYVISRLKKQGKEIRNLEKMLRLDHEQ